MSRAISHKKMSIQYLKIKELTQTVGGGITPRMVRHYHQLNLLPPAYRSEGNYRLYSADDVQRLRQIVALKEQGFQLSHIRKIVESDSEGKISASLLSQLHQQYQSIIKQLVKLRRTALALENLLGRDQKCQMIQAEVIAQLKCLEIATQDGEESLKTLWQALDNSIEDHTEVFAESLERLLPDLSTRNEIERDLLSKIVLACGDVSLVDFVRISTGAISAAREALSNGCQVIGDVPIVTAAFDQTRLAHLHCNAQTLTSDPHISSVAEAEAAFCNLDLWREKLLNVTVGSILVVGYAPSVLITICNNIKAGLLKPSLVIGMPIGFSHAPGAKRQLMRSGIPYITIEGTLGGGILASVALNALMDSLLEKPNCHCHLNS
jgi:precorrin-8X/cobalt-precorrin-8 methylmutase